MNTNNTAGPKTQPDILPATEEEQEVQPSPGEGWAVILFNDDHHDMVYVVTILCRATGFSIEQCWQIMMTAHNAGKAVVTIVDKPKAQEIANIIRQGGLIVELKPMG